MAIVVTEEIDILSKLSQFVKHRRKQLGLTQQEVADRIGNMDRIQYSKIERNRTDGKSIETRTLARVLSALDANISFTEN